MHQSVAFWLSRANLHGIAESLSPASVVDECFMQNSPAVWTLLSVDRYHQRWPKIPLTELQASGVQVRTADGSVQLVLLHKRRVSAAAARGEEPVYVCIDCHQAFVPKKARLCKFALAHDLWLGRIDPLLWGGQHDAREVLGTCPHRRHKSGAASRWCANGAGGHSSSGTTCIPTDWLRGFLAALPQWRCQAHAAVAAAREIERRIGHYVLHGSSIEDVDHGREAVRKIVQLRVRKDRLLQQAQVLMDTNVVYAAGVTKIDNEQLTTWLGGEDDVVPPAVLDCVLTVPIGRDGPGSMQEGPAQATAGNVSCNQDEVVFATEPEVKDFNDDETDVSSRVAIMLQKLEELEAAGARSVAVEMASLMEEDAVLLDHLVAAQWSTEDRSWNTSFSPFQVRSDAACRADDIAALAKKRCLHCRALTSLSHTPSFTRNFVTHTHTYIHTYVYAYYLFTYFHTQSFTISFVFPSFPVPARTFEAQYWKKLTCGVIRSFNFCSSVADSAREARSLILNIKINRETMP